MRPKQVKGNADTERLKQNHYSGMMSPLTASPILKSMGCITLTLGQHASLNAFLWTIFALYMRDVRVQNPPM
jgi:hypothetical protein